MGSVTGEAVMGMVGGIVAATLRSVLPRPKWSRPRRSSEAALIIPRAKKDESAWS